jgi:hypothetical protein
MVGIELTMPTDARLEQDCSRIELFCLRDKRIVE